MKSFHHIVITGASSGIGEALALDYAAPGIALGLTGRDDARLAKVVQACRAKGATVVAGTIDVTDRSAMSAWLTAFDDAHPVDLLVANAGISIDQEDPNFEPFDRVRATFAVNIDGVLNTVEPLVGRLIARRSGQIGLISSLAAFTGRPVAASYNASKAAVRVWGESIRFPLARDNVGVSVVCPGFVESRMSAARAAATPRPMSADRASQIIRDGLAHNRPRIAFPLALSAAVWFGTLLPARLMRT
ncbi:MAG TPA: SDR family NAD(P)-dependent oxidoreductase [Reyranella sp.]|nr:SDR family NAD(P)-dependent oxidoreductase [Reyranella sp.]